jgi:hypothetical protein
VLPALRASFNGEPLGDIPLTWNSQRVGAYEWVLRAASVRQGLNRVTFEVVPSPLAAANEGARGLGEGTAVTIWYARVRHE